MRGFAEHIKRELLGFAQSWTALFRAFSSHRQPSAIRIFRVPHSVYNVPQNLPYIGWDHYNYLDAYF